MRRERRLLVAEGEDLVDAALAAGARPVAMLWDEERLADDDPRVAATAGLAERYLVPPKLMAQASGLAAAPRVIAIVPQPRPRSFRDVRFPPDVGVYLAGVADPGNVGTLVRTADAFGAAVALSDGCADPLSPKALRASAGAIFRVPLVAWDVVPGRTVALAAHGGEPVGEADLTPPLTFLLGAEREGLPPDLAPGSLTVTIPLPGEAESLNVAAAGAIALYEYARRGRPPG